MQTNFFLFYSVNYKYYAKLDIIQTTLYYSYLIHLLLGREVHFNELSQLKRIKFLLCVVGDYKQNVM